MKSLPALTVAVASAVLVLAADFLPVRPEPLLKSPASIPAAPRDDAILAFSLEQVLAYFTEAFGHLPQKVRDRQYVFIDSGNVDESVVLTVSGREDSMSVVLLATGDYGVNYIREFFEAPFFSPSESEQMYELLDRGVGVHSARIGRMRVWITVAESRLWISVAVELRPAESKL